MYLESKEVEVKIVAIKIKGHWYRPIIGPQIIVYCYRNSVDDISRFIHIWTALHFKIGFGEIRPETHMRLVQKYAYP